jgi:two-component system response regulator QseB
MKVLFIEDNVKLGDATRKTLTRMGFAVDLFQTLEDGWHAWRVTTYDAVILDIKLGQESGLDLLAKARAAGVATPVVLLTALGSVGERVRGLEAGADDYLVKPFAIEELAARLKALGRRPAPLADDVIRFGDVVYETASRVVTAGRMSVVLSRGESIVLERLLRTPDRVITKSQLGESLHSLDEDFTDNSIHVHVHRVRRKLAELDAKVSIRALRGLGYTAVNTTSPL